MYGFFFYQQIVDVGGLADDMDKWLALAGLLILFEGARRALGPSTIFLAYLFFGSSELVPDDMDPRHLGFQTASTSILVSTAGAMSWDRTKSRI